MLAWIFGDCREGQIPRCLQRCKFDTPLLAAGSLIYHTIISDIFSSMPNITTYENKLFTLLKSVSLSVSVSASVSSSVTSAFLMASVWMANCTRPMSGFFEEVKETGS